MSDEEQGNRLFYDVKEDSQVEFSLCSGNGLNVDSPEVIAEFEKITSRDFDLFKEGMLKISVWPSGRKTIALMVFHHLLLNSLKTHVSPIMTLVGKILLALICAYGIYTFITRGVWKYLILQQQFFFFDFERGYVLFALDYISIIILFATISHLIASRLKKNR